MSVLYQTKAIVLGRRDHKEADRWYCVFTPDKGKVEFVARGGHKPLAKLTPHLEMVAIVDLLLVHGYVHQIVAGVDRCKAFPFIYEELSKLVLAQNALHLVDIGTRAQEPDPHIYDLLETWLGFLNTDLLFSAERSGFLLGAFALKLLALVGYRPELNRCLQCRRHIQSSQYQWHSLKGGVVCLDCTRADSQQWFSARPVRDEVLKLVRFGLEEPFESSVRLHLAGEDLLDFHETVESLIIAHFPTIPASSLRAACQIC